MTQIVNGLLCYFKHKKKNGHFIKALTVYNVSTGEKRRIYWRWREGHSFHLGYDPESRTYKLLTLKSQCPPVAHIMTLRPSSTPSTWRELNHDAAGISEGDYITWCWEMRISPSDGFLCWLWSVDRSPKGLVLFDINKEKFQKIWLPGKIVSNWNSFVVLCGRAQVMEHGRPAVSLWAVTVSGPSLYPYDGVCFEMDDDEGKRWSEQAIDPYILNPCFFLDRSRNKNGYTCELQMMKRLTSGFDACNSYDIDDPCCRLRSMMGKLHDVKVNVQRCTSRHFWSCCLDRVRIGFPSRVVDGNNFYLPLDDIFSNSR